MTTNESNIDSSTSQAKKKNWIKYLIILHRSAIVFFFFMAFLLAFFIINPTPSQKSESPGKEPGDIKPDFFESGSVYYVKSTLEDGIQEHIVKLLKTLKLKTKMANKSIEKDLGLDLNKISQSQEADPQYFFYKADENTIYTFIKSKKKKKPVPERITISILVGNDPTKVWGVYHLEKKLLEDSTGKYAYILERKEDRYKKPRDRLTDDDLKRIVEKLAGKIQETINENPRDTKKSGENLDFRFDLYRRGENNKYDKVEIKEEYKKFIFPLKPTQRSIKLPELKKDTEQNATHEVIDTFEIDEARIGFLESELCATFTYLFSPEDAEIFENQLKIYKNDQDISTEPIPDESFKKLKALLENEGYKHNNFKGWQPIFKSSLKGINFQEFIEYIGTRLKQLDKDVGKKGKGQYDYGNAILVGVAIVVFLIIYASLWYFIKLKLRSEPMVEGEGEIVETAEPERETDQVDADTGKTDEKTDAKRFTAYDKKIEIPKKDIEAAAATFQLDETKKRKLQKIRNSLEQARKQAVDIYTNALSNKGKPDALELDKIKVVDNFLDEMIKRKDINRNNFQHKLNQAKDTLKEFRNFNEINQIDPDLEKIQTELDNFEKMLTPPEPPEQGPEEPEKEEKKKETKKTEETKEEKPTAIPESITNAITNIEEILNKIKKKNYLSRILELFGLNKLFYRRLKKLDEKYQTTVDAIKNSLPDEEKEKFDPEQYLVDVLKAPIENKHSLEIIKQLQEQNNLAVGNIDAKIDQMIKDSQYESKMHLLISFINNEMDLLIDKDNVREIIPKVSEEVTISKEYRLCAVKLYDELSALEEKYQGDWFWELLAHELLPKLEENIDLFRLKNKETKSIYEKYFKKEILMREITPADIKKIIGLQHWKQIWDILIRISDFFNVYFDDKRKDIKLVLDQYSKWIQKLLNQLGYEIQHIKPLTLIPNDYRKQHNIEQIDKSKIEEQIIKNLVKEGNKKFLQAVEKIPPGYERVIFVDRLGLSGTLDETPVNISNLQIGAYNQTILNSYISSGGGKKQKPKDGLFPDYFDEDEEQ